MLEFQFDAEGSNKLIYSQIDLESMTYNANESFLPLVSSSSSDSTGSSSPLSLLDGGGLDASPYRSGVGAGLGAAPFMIDSSGDSTGSSSPLSLLDGGRLDASPYRSGVGAGLGAAPFMIDSSGDSTGSSSPLSLLDGGGLDASPYRSGVGARVALLPSVAVASLVSLEVACESSTGTSTSSAGAGAVLPTAVDADALLKSKVKALRTRAPEDPWPAWLLSIPKKGLVGLIQDLELSAEQREEVYSDAQKYKRKKSRERRSFR